MCGFLGHPRRPCRCTPHQIKTYRNRLSGPLLDRIDLRVEVPPVSARQIMRQGRSCEEASSAIRERVETAREIQRILFAARAGCSSSFQISLQEFEEFCRIGDSTLAFLQKAIESLSLSARAAHRSLRVARTIADLAGSENVQLEHVAEAVQYRAVERGAE